MQQELNQPQQSAQQPSQLRVPPDALARGRMLEQVLQSAQERMSAGSPPADPPATS